jgi:hypothetical protein
MSSPPVTAASASNPKRTRDKEELKQAKKQKKEEESDAESDDEENEIVAACKWFSKFYWTYFMFNQHKALAKEGVKFAEKEYEEYRTDTEHKHATWQKWVDADNGRSKKDKMETEPEPPAIMGRASWSFMNGPLTCEREFIRPWDVNTYKRIITAHSADNDHIAPFYNIERLLRDEDDAAEIDHKYHPIGMLLSGVVMRSNCKWLSKEDLRKVAMAHGCTDLDDDNQMLQDIYRSQIRICRQIVDVRIDMGKEARDYCVARGVLEDSKKALNLRVLREERPSTCDRTRRIPHSKKGFEGMYCKQCEYAFDEADAAVRDKYPEHLLDAICTDCSRLSCQ